MLTCKEVATALSNGSLKGESLVKRLSVALHLAMCRNCRSFARQLAWLKKASRRLGDALAGEPPAGFEARLLERLGEPRDRRR